MFSNHQATSHPVNRSLPFYFVSLLPHMCRGIKLSYIKYYKNNIDMMNGRSIKRLNITTNQRLVCSSGTVQSARPKTCHAHSSANGIGTETNAQYMEGAKLVMN